MKHPAKEIEKRVGVAGCKHTTKDLILGLERKGLRVDHCVTISPDKGEEQGVAGYYDLRPFLESRDLPYVLAEKYSLGSERDRDALLALDLDMLLVMGWQRLVPDWMLRSLSIGAFGMHGSSRPLPHGRGRSPLNWSLIQNKSIFFTHLFMYKPGVDDGDIVGVQRFDITPFDTCLALHFKNTTAMIQLCARHLPALMDGSADVRPQPEGGTTYYPKRSAEDGLIYWSDPSLDIHNLVRAVTKPFPGAFTFLDNDPRSKVFVWRAMPFDTHLEWPDAIPGQIVEAFEGGAFVVKTGDTSLIVVESEGHDFGDTDVGRVLGHCNTPRKKWENLPS